MSELPKINGRIITTKTIMDDGVKYAFDIEGGDIVGVPLEAIRSFLPDLVSISGDYLIVGNLGFNIIGYQSPGTLVCRLVDIGGAL